MTVAMTSYQSTSNMHWIVPTSRLQNRVNRFVVCWSWNVHGLVGIHSELYRIETIASYQSVGQDAFDPSNLMIITVFHC